jgi:hypothetical protein
MAFQDKNLSPECPAFVRVNSDDFRFIGDVLESYEFSKESFFRSLAELDKWCRYWEPIISRMTPDLDKVFLAIRELKKKAGDNWPTYEEDELEEFEDELGPGSQELPRHAARRSAAPCTGPNADRPVGKKGTHKKASAKRPKGSRSQTKRKVPRRRKRSRATR